MAQGDVGIYASQISGHLWAPNGAYDALSTVTVGSTSVATVTFSGIPQGYKHLQIRYIGRTNWATTNADHLYYLNGDTTNANYSYHRLGGEGSVAFSQASTSSRIVGINAGANATAGMFGVGIMDILDYTSNKYKTVKNLVGFDRNGGGLVALYSNLWRDTNPVTSITLVTENGSWVQNSQFALYGVK